MWYVQKRKQLKSSVELKTRYYISFDVLHRFFNFEARREYSVLNDDEKREETARFTFYRPPCLLWSYKVVIAILQKSPRVLCSLFPKYCYTLLLEWYLQFTIYNISTISPAGEEIPGEGVAFLVAASFFVL
jgi:hypothetical protein